MENPDAPRSNTPISLTLINTPLALCRLAPSDAVPHWAASARAFLSITRTRGELSIVADDAVVPREASTDRQYRAYRVDGPMSLDLVGVMAKIATALADAKVPIFPIATYDTDYILVHSDHLSAANAALMAAGHRLSIESSE